MPPMPLIDAQIRSIQPAAKAFKVFDGKGLYLEVFPTGSKLWRLKYRIAGKEKRLALGAYPERSLADARKARDLARMKIADGVDPSLERKRDKLTAKIAAAETFEAIADEYISKMEAEGRAAATVTKARWFLSLLKSAIGNMPCREVDRQFLLAELKRLEHRT